MQNVAITESQSKISIDLELAKSLGLGPYGDTIRKIRTGTRNPQPLTPRNPHKAAKTSNYNSILD